MASKTVYIYIERERESVRISFSLAKFLAHNGHSIRNWRDFPGGPVVKTPASSAQGAGVIPSWRTNIPQTAQCSQKKMK